MRGPPFCTGCCAGFIGRRMANISSAVTPILVSGGAENMTAATRRWRARNPSPLTNSEPVKIGTNPSQVNAGAGSKKRRGGGATWLLAAKIDRIGGKRPGGPCRPACTATIFSNGVNRLCLSALALEQVGIRSEEHTSELQSLRHLV